MPYDQTTFGKFHMWQSVLLLAIAASPVWYLRATFFTLFLGCLMRDMEEFQFVRFILGLKGSGFISGVIAAVKVSIDLWQCTVLKPMTCHLNGPGVGNAVGMQIYLICWLQILVWVTFLLLPYTSKRTAAGPIKPKQPGLKGAMSTISSGGAKKVGGMGLLNRFQGNSLKKRPAGGTPKKGVSPYMPLKEEKPGDLPSRTDLDGQPVYDFEPGRFCNFSGDNRMVVLLFWDLLCFGSIGALYVCSLKYLAENPDLLSAADPYDFSCQAYGEGCSHNASSNASSAWGPRRLSWFGASTDQDVEASTNQDVVNPYPNLVNDTQTFVIRDLDPWTNWQAQITLHVCRVLFSISSLPFLLFMVPFLRTIFTHTSPTGYTKQGECVLLDTQGLTGFLSWLKDMLARRSTRSKLLHADAVSLRRAIWEAELLLEKHPFSRKLHAKCLRVTMDLLQQTINYRHPLYVDFFPDDVLTREFEKNLAEQGLLSAKSHKLYEQRQDKEKTELKALRKATPGVLGPKSKKKADDPYSA